jgi:glycerophosphoryl diester phosphodiesterase
MRFEPEVVHIDFSFYNPEVVELIKSNKSRIWINALGKSDQQIVSGDTEQAVDELLKYGANIIQTDQPGLLLEELRKRNLHK